MIVFVGQHYKCFIRNDDFPENGGDTWILHNDEQLTVFEKWREIVSMMI
jgi:hypothetical protein